MNPTFYDQLQDLLHNNPKLDIFNLYFLGLCTEYISENTTLAWLLNQLPLNFPRLFEVFMGNKHEIGFISRTLLRIIHNIPPEDRISSNQEIFGYESSEIEEDLKRILKDFELVRLLYPRVTKYQWFYLGTFMAKNRDCELLALLKGIYIELLVKNYKYDEKGKVEFLAVLLSEKCKTESFPPSSRATRVGKMQVISSRLTDLKRDLRSLRNVRNDLNDKEKEEQPEGKRENNMMNLRVNPLSLRKETPPPEVALRASNTRRPVIRPLIANENKNPLKEGEPKVVFQSIYKDLGPNFARRPLQVLDTNLEKANKVVEPLIMMKCSPLLVEKIQRKEVQGDMKENQITLEEMKEMREMREKKEMEEIRRVKEMKEKAMLEREKLEREMKEAKEKEMLERQMREMIEVKERLMREREREIREVLEQEMKERERERQEKEMAEREMRAAKEMEEMRRMKEREMLERERREKELLERERARREREMLERERKEKKEDIALISGPSGQIRPTNNPPQRTMSSLEMIRAPFLSKKLPECPICFDVITLSTTLSLKACRHLFHNECLKQYFQTKISEKSFPIACAMDGCTSKVLESQIVEVLDQTYKEKFYSFSLKFFAEKNPNEVFCCPTPDCEYLVFKDPGTKSFYCTKCSKAFCVQCKEEWHDGKTCEENKAEDVLEKQFFEYIGTKGCQKCPSCLYYIEKNEGCNHMTCRCGKEFCYSCLSDMNECTCRQPEDDYY